MLFINSAQETAVAAAPLDAGLGADAPCRATKLTQLQRTTPPVAPLVPQVGLLSAMQVRKTAGSSYAAAVGESSPVVGPAVVSAGRPALAMTRASSSPSPRAAGDET